MTPTGNSWQKPRVRDTASQVVQHNLATSGHLQGLHRAEIMAQGTWEATAPTTAIAEVQAPQMALLLYIYTLESSLC